MYDTHEYRVALFLGHLPPLRAQGTGNGMIQKYCKKLISQDTVSNHGGDTEIYSAPFAATNPQLLYHKGEL